MLDIPIRNLGNMHQTVLMHTDIYEHTEIDHISDCPLKDHAFFQIVHLQHIRAQDRFGHLVARISRRLLQFFHNIAERDLTDPQLFSKLLIVFDRKGQSGQIVLCHVFRRVSLLLQQLFRRLIGLRMHPCAVQRVLPLCDPHESGALFECLRSQLRYFKQLPAVRESAILFPVCHDIFSDRSADAGNVGEKRR